MHRLQSKIGKYYSQSPMPPKTAKQALAAFKEFRQALTSGKIGAAEKKDGQWTVNAWVKQGILLGFRLGVLQDMSGAGALSFVDKNTFPARQFKPHDRIRVVPGGSSVRQGA